MRVSEQLPIDSLYALEQAMLRYPGVELEGIHYDAMTTVREDPLTGEEVWTNFFVEGLVIFKFRGPRFGHYGRPRAVVPLSRFAAEEPLLVGDVLETAVESMEKLVETRNSS